LRARPISVSMIPMTLSIASLCAWCRMARSALVGAKAQATDSDFGAENVRSI